MTLRPYKIIVALVLQEVEDGQVTGEEQVQPTVFFSAEKAADWLEHLDEHVSKLNDPDGT